MISRWAILCITVLFVTALIVIGVLKWHDPAMDATFVTVYTSAACTMAYLVINYFKQSSIAEKVEKVPTKEEIYKEVESVKKLTESQIIQQTEDIKQVTEKQTEDIKQVTEKQTEELKKEIGSNSPDV